MLRERKKMIVFRCSRCSKVNISTEQHSCLHCGYEETQVSSIPDKPTEVRSASMNNNDVLHLQNILSGIDCSILPQASEKRNAAKLQTSNGNEKDTKALITSSSHISSSQGESVRQVAQNPMLTEMLILPSTNPFSNSVSCASSSTKKRKHISGQSSRHKSKNNLKEKKMFKHNKNSRSIKKFYLGNPRPCSPEKSVLESLTKEGINVNQLKDNQRKANSGILLSINSNQTVNNDFQDDLEITKASSEVVFRKGCIKNDLSEKLLINRIKTPIPKKLFLCNICKKAFIDESKLKVHFENHFKEKCFKCDKVYLSEVHLNRNYESHMDKGPFRCDLRDLVFFGNIHHPFRHGKKPILEPTVDASAEQEKVDKSSQQRKQETSYDEDLQKHFFTSAEEKIFLCTECGTKFIRESDFNAHSLRHNVQKPFKCNKCNKGFRYESHLNTHYRTHYLERPCSC